METENKHGSKIEKEIEITIKSPLLILLILISLVYFYFELKVVLPTNISFGDEGFHTSMARYIARNLEYPKYIPFEGSVLIRDGFYRPPLWNFLLASFFFIFGINEIIAKTITLIITFFLGLLTFALVKRISDEITAFFASLLLISFQSVLTYTVLFYYADLLLFFVTASFLSFLVFIKEGNKRFFLLSAIFASLALLTNQFALTLYAIYSLYFLYEFLSEKKYLSTIKLYLPFFILLILIPSGYLVRNILTYKTPLCFSIPYIGKLFDNSQCKLDKFEEKYNFVGQAIPIGTEASAFSIGLMNYLEFAYANTFFTILPFITGLILFYFKRDKTSILIFITFLIFAILLAEIGRGRAEDAARYTLGFASLVAFVAAYFYKELFEFVEKYFKYLGYLILLAVVVFSFSVAKARLDTLYKVKVWDPSFFEACKWVKENTLPNATISTIWGHNGAWCSDRNMGPALADILLSNDLNYTLKVLKENQIEYLWIQKSSIDPLNRGYADNYPSRFIQMLIDNPQYFVKVYENGQPIEQCLQGCYGQTIFRVNVTNL
ncbi:MAG: glycosyltransferase family 39 protein, partial [Candidatus Aenigmarchaeota archaeon]|nr:glycosyltransferase family 39 protein [Candidatus Aenigmarchaeota archaeon]